MEQYSELPRAEASAKGDVMSASQNVAVVNWQNRVWTGFLYGIGFWLGSIIGVTVFSIFVGIVLVILSAFGLASAGAMMQGN